MIQRIYPHKGSDLIFQIVFLEDVDDFNLTFFTDNSSSGITKSKTDLKEDNLIKIEASELATLNEGLLKVFMEIKTSDSDFQDGYYNEIQEMDTNYYLKKNGI